MPRIDIVAGSGRRPSEFSYTPIPGEVLLHQKDESLKTTLASTQVRSARNEPVGYKKEAELGRAVNSLETFVPPEAAKQMVDALLRNEVGSHVVLIAGDSGTIYDVKEIVTSSPNS